MTRYLLITVLIFSVALSPLGGQRRVSGQSQAAAARRDSQTALAGELMKNRFDALLMELSEWVDRQRANGTDARRQSLAELENLPLLRERLAGEHEKNRRHFSHVEELLGQKSLPTEIRQRHAEFVRQYQSKYDALTAHLESIESAQKTATGLWSKLTGQSQSAWLGQVIEQTASFLEANLPKPRLHQGFDPHNLPHRSLKARQTIAPKLTREEWLKAFPKEAASAGPAPGPTAGPISDNRTGAETGDTHVPHSPLATGPPVPADLAETIEVKFTLEIRQLADSLDRNPVKIFNWVRNNIEFVPTWGSIQGAQLCLETKSCNAFDTTSLLITLLRVSGIPARYQMGTIEVPIEKFKNWAGGFTNAEVAASLFASGGVPSVVRRVDESGQVVTVRLEHLWVKAFVDYKPSGGAVNRSGNTWVEMDPSFKQHTLSSPTQDLTSVVSFNRDAYLSSAFDNSPVEFYRQALVHFVEQNHPGKTLDDFLYKKTIRIFDPPILGGALPYKLLAAGVGFSDIPAQLRQQVTVTAGSAQANAPLTYTAPLPALLGKRLTLSFMPASTSDVQTATSFAGLYRTPPYLISVKPVLRVDGQEVAAGAPMGMGQSLEMTFLLDLPGLGRRTVRNTITAGAYLTILLAPHLVNEALGNKLAREFRRADDRFGTLNLDNSDRDPSVGGMLQVLSSYYFNRLDESIGTLKDLSPIAQLKTAFAAYVSSDVEAASLFGAATALQFTGISIDADLLEGVTLARDGISGPALSFERLRGLESSYWEHGIFGPEEAGPEQPAISTVRVLREAKRVGVTIHEINAGNLAAIEPQLQVSPADREAIRDAVNAGLVVTIPASGLQLGNWRGVGYILEDPLTGAGAYQISGGLSGGAITIPLLQPHLVGGPPPSGQPVAIPRWPTAIIAVGWPVDGGSLDRGGSLDNMITRLHVNRWTVSDSIGFQIYSRGYNVYTADVDAETFVDFVEETGVRTDFDVFCYIGPTSHSGHILLDNSQGNRSVFAPGSFPRNFWLSYLSGNTGGICNSFGFGISCTRNESLILDWWLALGTRPDEELPSGAVIGFSSLDYLGRAKRRADRFWAEMASGSNAFDAASGLSPSVYRQCRGSFVPGGCNVVLRGYGQ